MNVMYTAVATASGDGRNGHSESEDGQLSVDVRVPKEMGGPGGGTNPEQLFAAGYAACFHSALKVAGRSESADLTDSQVSASVGIGDSPSRSTSTPRASTGPMRWSSPARPISCARTPTPSRETSTSPSASCDGTDWFVETDSDVANVGRAFVDDNNGI